MTPPARPLDALRRNGMLMAAAPRIGSYLGERAGATRAALDLTARVVAGGAAVLASSPFGAARLRDEALGGPFDAGRPAFDDPFGVPPSACGATLGDGSAAAVGLFGVAALARLAGEVAAVTGLSTLSAARLPALVVPVLLAACRVEALRVGGDTAALARAVIQDGSRFAAAPHARRVALGAGWTGVPVPGAPETSGVAPVQDEGRPALERPE
ncbi:MAG: hypothetical protein EHM87_12220 [Burkholderiales bacterium]|nr:MAG: hypothetical protein EHM87_12220 [Burkholderiales bacterium]